MIQGAAVWRPVVMRFGYIDSRICEAFVSCCWDVQNHLVWQRLVSETC